ncbi:MAG: VOC family protein [Bdellovibrionota bacterium]
MPSTTKIVPNLWFDGQGEDAARFYTSIFPNSKILEITRYPNVGQEIHGKPAGSVMTVLFTIEGQEYIALNGGPQFKFSPAFSLQVNVDTQEEIDALSAKLSEGGEVGPCGWVTDKFGFSWQVVPRVLEKWIHDPNPAKVEHVMAAMLKMKKLDISKLKQAYQA